MTNDLILILADRTRRDGVRFHSYLHALDTLQTLSLDPPTNVDEWRRADIESAL